MLTVAAIVVGFILDLILGDPHWLPHPICLIGNLISFLEKTLRRLFGFSQQGLLIGGALLVVLVAGTAYIVPYLVLHFATLFSWELAFVLESIMFYQIFATKCLKDESMKVFDALDKNDLEDARLKLSWIVGRDTKELSTAEVTKATVETVAENTADGIIAPMLFMFLGGAPLAFLYKGINTMDSMVGYKNDKYLYFGRAAAKMDDVFNFIPARLTGMVMIIASYFLNMDTRGAWKIFWRDRYNHLSPNSAMTESVAAGALNIQLGGGHYYFGKWVPKKTIGDDIRPVDKEDIVKVNNLLYLTAIISLMLFSLVSLLDAFKFIW